MLRFAIPPHPELLRHALLVSVTTTGPGDFGAETGTIGYAFVLESVYLYYQTGAGTALRWNIMVDNADAGGARSPFDGTRVITTQSDDQALDPSRARLVTVRALTIRPRFAWRHPGYRLRLAVNCDSNPIQIGAILDLAPLRL